MLIVRKPPKRDPDAVPLPLPQQYPKVSRRVSPKLRAVNRVFITASSQSLLYVRTERSELSVLEPSFQLHEKHSLALANVIELVQPQNRFKVLVENLSVNEKILQMGQVVGTAVPHPQSLPDASAVTISSVPLGTENRFEFSLKEKNSAE